MRVLVTCATGSVGEPLVKRLLEEKVEVRAAVRDASTPAAQALQKAGVDVVAVNWNDLDSLVRVLDGVDKVAFISPLTEDHQLFSEQWIAAFRAQKAQIKHIVRLSQLTADDPKFLFAKWHAFIEVLIKILDVPFTFIRANAFIQTHLNLYGPIISKAGIHSAPLKEIKIAYVDANDVADVMAKTLLSDDYKYKELDLNGPSNVSQPELLGMVEEATGKHVPFEPMSLDDFRRLMTEQGLADIMVEGLVDLHEVLQDNKDLFATADSSVKDVLGREPISVKRFIESHTDLFRSAPASQ